MTQYQPVMAAEGSLLQEVGLVPPGFQQAYCPTGHVPGPPPHELKHLCEGGCSTEDSNLCILG